jgi:hypothetical protein
VESKPICSSDQIPQLWAYVQSAPEHHEHWQLSRPLQRVDRSV